MGPTEGHHRRRVLGGRTLRSFRGFCACGAAGVLFSHPAHAAVFTASGPGMPLALMAAAPARWRWRRRRRLWALAERRPRPSCAEPCGTQRRGPRAAVGARDALIGAGSEPFWCGDATAKRPVSYGGGELLLDSCLAGPDALAVSQASTR